MNTTNLEQKEQGQAAKAIDLPVFLDFTHKRHSVLMEVGGGLTKIMNIKEVSFALNIVNETVFPNPVPQEEFADIVTSLGKYIDEQEANVKKSVLDYIALTDSATKQDIEFAVFDRRVTGKYKVLLDTTLFNLIQEHKIFKNSSWGYEIVKKIQWSDNISDVGMPIKFEMPYFHNYANFNYGDVAIIGGATKTGKTTLAMNLSKDLLSKALNLSIFTMKAAGVLARQHYNSDLKTAIFITPDAQFQQK